MQELNLTLSKTLDPRSKPEILKSVQDPKAYIEDFGHAVDQLRTAGYDDVVRFSQGVGLQISVPEDTGFGDSIIILED